MKKILLVDDETQLLELVKSRLETNGYEVITASDGDSALAQAKQKNPDLIILDVMMPPPNGFQVCRTLKDDPEYKHIPIIILTAKATESDKFWGMEAEADEYVTKPFDPDEFLEMIKDILDE